MSDGGSKSWVKNKCGPGQPPGPHCFWRNVLFPFSTHEAWGRVHLFTGTPKNAGGNHTRQIPICEASLADQSAALRWLTASPAVCGGLCEEAATPGQPVMRRSAYWRNPPANSPSRIAGNRQLCRNALAGHTEHLAECQHCAPGAVLASREKPRVVVQKL
jgi:hypothetical protein